MPRSVVIGVLDRETGLIHFPYGITRGVRDPVEPLEPSGLSRHVMETREPLLINEGRLGPAAPRSAAR